MDAYFTRGTARFMRPSVRLDSRASTEVIRFSEHLIHRGQAYAYAVSAPDFTGNGSMDLLAVDTNVGMHLFENDGQGNFTRHVIRRRVGEWLERHAIADINGDGKLEIVSVDNTNGCLLYFEYDGDPRDGESWTHHYVTEGELAGAYDLTIADLDVAASSWRIGTHFAWFENRDGSRMKHMVEDNVGETRAIHAVDGDGHPDLLVTAFTGDEIMWYRNPGDPTSQPWEKYVIDSSPGPMHGHPVAMDVDGDFDVVMTLRGSDDPAALGVNQIVWHENDGSPQSVP